MNGLDFAHDEFRVSSSHEIGFDIYFFNIIYFENVFIYVSIWLADLGFRHSGSLVAA